MKILLIIGSMFLLLILMPSHTYSQDILYKKDLSVLEVNIKALTNNVITYQIPGDSAGKICYISLSVIDSLKYSSGKSLVFTGTSDIKELPRNEISRNYIGTEIVNLVTGKPSLEYERISKNGRSSIVAGVLINFRDNIPEFRLWDGHYAFLRYLTFNPHYFFIRLGVNLYPFNYSLSSSNNTRLSTGFSLLVGSYRKIDYNTYYWDGENFYYEINPILAGSLMWNTKGRLYVGRHLQVTGCVEVSLLPFLTFFCPQAGISLGF